MIQREEFEIMNRTFKEVPSFTAKWKALGLTDEDLRRLENILLKAKIRIIPNYTELFQPVYTILKVYTQAQLLLLKLKL